MRCTVCSEDLSPVVAVDIDGTLGDYHGHFARFAAGYTNESSQILAHWLEYDGSVPYNEWLGMSKDEYRAIKLAYRQGGMKRTMPVYDDVRGMFDMLRREGAEIWITTTRPYLRLDNIDPDTREWCKRNGLEYDFLLYDEEKYVQLADRVGVDRVAAILEDDPEQIDMVDGLYKPGVIIQAWGPHNRHPLARRNPGVASLSGARALVRDRLYEWKERYE